MRRVLFLVSLGSVACSSSSSPVSAVPLTATLSATPKAISNPVDVVRDQWGIPHIYGQSIPDVAYAQGYFMAMDRWVELDLLRRAADGSLAEIIGPVELASDVGMRVHHLRKTAETGLANLQASSDPTDQIIVQTLTAFAAGVNAWQADLAAGKYTLPSQLADIYSAASVTPWKTEDSVLLGEFLAWQLAFDDSTDLVRTDLDLAVAQTFPAGDPRANINADLENTEPTDPASVIPGGWGFNLDNSQARRDSAEPKKIRDWPRSKAGRKLRKLLDADVKALAAVGFQSPQQLLHGSNNWVIGPKHSTTGHVLVANDTHLSLQNPPVFYMNHLVARSGNTTLLNVMGEQFPGVPAVTLGMNQHNAWAATVNYIDVTDLYQDAISACAGGVCTTFNGAQVPLTTDVETFNVGTLGQVMTAVATVTYYEDPNHGPILPRVDTDAAGNFTQIEPLNMGGSEISIKYTGYNSAPLLKAIYGLDTATSMQGAVAALDPNFRYGGQNWVIGDDQGNFGWTQTVENPIRNVPAGQSSIVPFKVMPGDGTAEWAGSMDPTFIPHAYNHPQGYISTANNDPIGTTLLNDAYYGQPLADGGNAHLYLGVDYDPGTREGRIENRINSIIGDGGTLSLDDMSSIQADTITEYGQLMQPVFLDAVGALVAALANGPGDGGPSDVSAYALDAGAVQPLFAQVNGWVQGWSFDTPSGISDPDAGAPTAQQISDSQAALVMAVFTNYFVHQTFDDEVAKLGGTTGPFYVPDSMQAQTTIRLAVHPEKTADGGISPVTGDPIEFDDLTTPTITESKRQTAARAIVAELQFLVSQLGPTSANWRWGQLHTLTLDFAVAALGLNIPPTTDPVYPNGFPRHGAAGTVDVGGNSISLNDFTYDQGPAIRFTCELDPDAGPHGRNVLPGGEVFDPKSPHYRDQMELWRKNQTIDWAYQDSDVVSSAQTEYSTNKIGRTHFTP